MGRVSDPWLSCHFLQLASRPASHHNTPYCCCHAIPYQDIPYQAMPYYAMPYHTIPYHIMPHHNIPYHTIPCHAILIHTKQCQPSPIMQWAHNRAANPLRNSVIFSKEPALQNVLGDSAEFARNFMTEQIQVHWRIQYMAISANTIVWPLVEQQVNVAFYLPEVWNWRKNSRDIF